MIARRTFVHLLFLLVPLLSFAQSDRSSRQLMSGEWAGTYHDIHGVDARLEMTLTVDGAIFSGTCRVTAEVNGQSSSVDLPVQGLVTGDTVTFIISTGPESLRGRKFHGTLRPGGPTALQAVYGKVDDPGGRMLGGGVWIVWRKE